MLDMTMHKPRADRSMDGKLLPSHLQPTTEPDKPIQGTVHHKTRGPAIMYALDADAAVRNHPDEWAEKPWPQYVAPRPLHEPASRPATTRRIFHVTHGA